MERIYHYTCPFYSHTSTPSFDQRAIFKVAPGLPYRIRSEWKLAKERRLNLGFMWSLRYDIDEIPLDHSILSKNKRGPTSAKGYTSSSSGTSSGCVKLPAYLKENEPFLDTALVTSNTSLNSLIKPEEYLAKDMLR